MPHFVPLKVQVVAQTQFTPPADVPWDTDVDGGQALVEFAGRACYQSWSKSNPATATNEGFVRHLLDVGHLSALEHGSVSMYVSGISRSLAHELIRHRHFSFSELSQRHVPDREAAFVEPAAIAGDPDLHERFSAATEAALTAYLDLLRSLEDEGDDASSTVLRRRQARQVARSILPSALESKIVVTGNYRAWRHFVAMRGADHADVEMRELAIVCLRELQGVAPHVFSDFRISRLADGSEVAASPYVTEA